MRVLGGKPCIGQASHPGEEVILLGGLSSNLVCTQLFFLKMIKQVREKSVCMTAERDNEPALIRSLPQ